MAHAKYLRRAGGVIVCVSMAPKAPPIIHTYQAHLGLGILLHQNDNAWYRREPDDSAPMVEPATKVKWFFKSLYRTCGILRAETGSFSLEWL